MSSSNTKSLISLPALLQGLGVVVVLYAILAGYAASRSDQTRQDILERLTSTTIPVAREAPDLEAPSPVQSEGAEKEASPEEDIPVEEVKEPPLEGDPEKIVAVEDVNAEPLVDPAVISENNAGTALPPAPIDRITEEKPYGLLPKVADNGLTAFEAYKRPFTPTGRPLISVIVTDFGISETLSATAIERLPATVTFMMSAYTAQPDEWRQAARADGHELWLQTPVQTRDFPFMDAGPQALSARDTLQDTRDKMAWVLSRTTGYAGIGLYTDSALEVTKPVVDAQLRESLQRGIGLVELNPRSTLDIGAVAARVKAPAFQAVLHVAAVLTPETLQKAEETARKHGYTIMVVPAYARNIDTLASWINGLELDGLSLAPLSAIQKVQQ